MARPHAPRGQGRARVIDAALELFAEHGVSGTSLQMIADHLGVTKAAVYYQFHAKEDIVLAVVESAFDEMRGTIADAEAAASADDATGVALAGLVDLIIGHRQVMASVSRDPELGRILESHEAFNSLTSRLGELLLGPVPDTRRRVAASVIGGLAHAAADPLLADIDDAVLREQLLHLGTLLLSSGSPTRTKATS
ncbi:TetR/AcrR family transcriptional regulator [Nocardioides mesophilus]|uniref:TetR/AcrR family transcriptional regulator n=1 Tax=Nocardioides mesophilus TaxID=433659 RepID=A0A7G9RCC7_9ACTN|nr:TetR/AcrR family transcriptional regulator [Nocardioides mesophilus]QNN53252.1 TetR/AcrR family transcriptional regulator [Nocardioides mesophilus]